MFDITDWAALTPTERDKLIETEIMGTPSAYTTSLDAAYLVVDEMVRLGCYVSLFQGSGTPRTCSIWDADKPSHISKQVAETVPEAICLAAIDFFRSHKK